MKINAIRFTAILEQKQFFFSLKTKFECFNSFTHRFVFLLVHWSMINCNSVQVKK
jgi:hypothetical protein